MGGVAIGRGPRRRVATAAGACLATGLIVPRGAARDESLALSNYGQRDDTGARDPSGEKHHAHEVVPFSPASIRILP